MSPTGKLESLQDAYGTTLADLGERDANLVVVDSTASDSTRTVPFRARFPDRFFPVAGKESTLVPKATELALTGRTVFASTIATLAAGPAYHSIRESVCYHRANVTIVATHGGPRVGGEGGTPPMLEDIGLMRGLPGMTVVVPADAPSARAAVFAIAAQGGPAYLRLSLEELPTVSDGSFQIGRAAELRAGSDLTIIAVGALVARGLEVAEELAQVGVSVRVLDLASVKPFDQPTVLRAARETGALLVLEEHTVTTGVGAMVAAATSENYPVPVRRVGVPDVFVDSAEPGAILDRFGMSNERTRDEAWELLKLRGKVQ